MRKPTRHKGIVQLGRNHFEIRARAKCPRTGKRKEVRRESRCGLKEARALQEQWRDELEAKLATPTAPMRVRLADFVPSWLSGRLANGELKPSSAEKIATVWDLHVEGTKIADLYIDDVHPEDVEEWLADQRVKTYRPGKGKASKRTGKPRRYSAGAIRGQYRVLASIIAAATARQRLPNPCDGVATPRKGKRRKGNVLRADELERVLSFMRAESPEWYPAVLLDAFTGLRWGELSALRWDDIDEAACVIHVQRSNWKGKVIDALKCDDEDDDKEKVVPLLDAVAEVLHEHRRRMVAEQHPGLATGWIFPTQRGTLHKGSPLRKVLDRAVEAAEIGRRVTPHGLRHTANDLLRRAASGDVVRAIIGHSTPQMTTHYSHVDEDEKRAAVQRAFAVVTGGKGVATGVASTDDEGSETSEQEKSPAVSQG
jgi:integrase